MANFYSAEIVQLENIVKGENLTIVATIHRGDYHGIETVNLPKDIEDLIKYCIQIRIDSAKKDFAKAIKKAQQ